MSDYNEEAYENALIELFQNMGWEDVYGPEVERDVRSPLYDSVLEDSIRRLNPNAPAQAISEALLKLRNFENAELVKKNAPLTENIIKQIHSLVLADKKDDRGVYRRVPVRIMGAHHEPVQPYLIEPKITELLAADEQRRETMKPIEMNFTAPEDGSAELRLHLGKITPNPDNLCTGIQI